MEKILIPMKSKLEPEEVLKELEKFKEVHKSPYSKTYYDTPNITWEYKPEGSLRLSDHWNFKSRGNIHCQLSNTSEYIEDRWLLAQYRNGKYHILNDFGSGIDGYIYIELDKRNLNLLKALYLSEGIMKSYDWYKQYRVKPILAKEGYMKNVKSLLQYISIDRITKFKNNSPKAKKIIFIENKSMKPTEKSLYVLEESKILDNLTEDVLFDKYNAYRLNHNINSSKEEVFILILENNIAVNFNFINK